MTAGPQRNPATVALVLPNSIFFHVPKAGGTFVRRTIRDLGIESEEKGDPHISLVDFADTYPEVLADRYTFTFVRHPLDWWRSYWSHRDLRGWAIDHPMDRECNDTDFGHYMDQVLRSDWRDHYLQIVRSVVTARMDYVGRQENLRVDLTAALTEAGEKFDHRSLGRLGMINRSDSLSARYSPGQSAQVMAIHHELIQRYYVQRPSTLRRIGDRLRALGTNHRPASGSR